MQSLFEILNGRKSISFRIVQVFFDYKGFAPLDKHFQLLIPQVIGLVESCFMTLSSHIYNVVMPTG